MPGGGTRRASDGLIDPKVTIKPLKGQIDDLIEESRKRAD
jgi:excinuclease ABC subunit B